MIFNGQVVVYRVVYISCFVVPIQFHPYTIRAIGYQYEHFIFNGFLNR